MNRQERRRKRLASLISEAGTQVALAESVSRAEDEAFPPNYISQMLHGHRQITDEMAERLERATYKRDGWMDQWTPDEGGWAENQRHPDWYLLNRYQAIPDDETKKLIRQQILHASKGPEAPPRKRRASK